MGRFKKAFMWGAGFIVLALLIQFPMQKVDTTWQTWSLPLSGKTIVIDPGHGGVDGEQLVKMRRSRKILHWKLPKKHVMFCSSPEPLFISPGKKIRTLRQRTPTGCHGEKRRIFVNAWNSFITKRPIFL